MNFHRMRRIDQYVGVPLCILLTAWKSTLGRLVDASVPEGRPQKIVFVKLIEQGSTILAYDALRRAIELVGRENVYFYVFEENKFPLQILNMIPEENIFSVRVKGLHRFAIDILKTLWKVRSQKIDTLIDLEFFARGSAILSYLTGIPRRIGLDRFTADAPYRGNLMTHKVQYNSYIHTAQYFRLLVEVSLRNPAERPLMKALPPEKPTSIPPYVPTSQELEALKKKLQELDAQIFNGPIVLLNANASDLLPLRKWDEKNYIELAKRIRRDYPSSTILFTGAPAERGPIEQIVKAIGAEHVHSVAGLTNFRELFALYTLSDVLVTNDSGPGHFSSLSDMYAITLFGPETPFLYGAIGANKVAITKSLACSPCVNVFNHRFSPCTNNVCMQQITVDEVYVHVKKGLESRATPRYLTTG